MTSHGLSLKGYDDFPSLTNSLWKSAHQGVFESSDARILYNELPTEEGLYYLWLKGSGTDIKSVYGQAIIEVGTVTKITTEQPKTDKTDKTDNTETGNKPATTTDKTTSTPTTKATDTTTATYKTLPNTGVSMVLIGSILLMIIGVIALLSKYHKYKDIK